MRWAAERDLHVIATVIVAYGAYLAADALHLSGIFAAAAIALALSLSPATPFREDILDAVYIVVAATILVQGLARAPIMRRLRL